MASTSPDLTEVHGLRNIEPEPVEDTEPGYEWRCIGCTFRTGNLMTARTHALGNDETACLVRMLVERPPGSEDPWPKVARRRIFVWKGDLLTQVSKRRKRG